MTDKNIPDVGETIHKLEQHVEALESRNAFQDDVIEQLNNELTIHQSEIAELKAQLKIVAERIKSNSTVDTGKIEQEPPPPHY